MDYGSSPFSMDRKGPAWEVLPTSGFSQIAESADSSLRCVAGGSASYWLGELSSGWPLRRCWDPFASMRSIDFDTLVNRLPEVNLPVELALLARCFNEALARLDRGAQREIRFNANVAHELRTPVAELRAIAEVGLQEAREGALESPASYFEDATALPFGDAAIHLSAIYDRAPLIRRFVEQGVDVDIPTAESLTNGTATDLFETESFAPFDGHGKTPLMLALGEGQSAAVDV